MPQISRSKFDRLWRTTAGFTTGTLDGYVLPSQLPARPAAYASHPIFLHRLAPLLCASFRPHLAVMPMRFAVTSRPSRCEEDLHLQAVEHARHTQKWPAVGLLQAMGTFKLSSLSHAPSPDHANITRRRSRCRCPRTISSLPQRQQKLVRPPEKLRSHKHKRVPRCYELAAARDHGWASASP